MLSHACGAAFDNPDLIVAAVVGDGESETGPLATSWHINKFLNPVRDGAVLPILHLNGYKINNPTVAGAHSARGAGEPAARLRLDAVLRRGLRPRQHAPGDGGDARALRRRDPRDPAGGARQRHSRRAPRWPMIVLRSPKGWTAPAGSRRPQAGRLLARAPGAAAPTCKKDPEQLEAARRLDAQLQARGAVRRDTGSFVPELSDLAPDGHAAHERQPARQRRTAEEGAAPARLPRLRDQGREARHRSQAENTRPLGDFLRDVMKANMHELPRLRPRREHLEQARRHLRGQQEVLDRGVLPGGRRRRRAGARRPGDGDAQRAHAGRHARRLSAHRPPRLLLAPTRPSSTSSTRCSTSTPSGWRSATTCRGATTIASLNLLITSTVWRQDHNGFTHQDPGFLDVVVNKSADVTRIYLPPDVNSLLSVADHCLRSENYVNVIVSDKQKHLQYMDMDAAIIHCTKGIGIWDWASNDEGGEPDVVMASAGDIPTQEALAATALLREEFPDLKIRFVNVVDLFKLQPSTEHPHGLSDRDFDSLFTVDKPIIFNFHGYPWLIHRLAYRRTNHDNLHVRGYKEKGNINTPLELAINNQIDRFSLAIDVIDRVPRLQRIGGHAKEQLPQPADRVPELRA